MTIARTNANTHRWMMRKARLWNDALCDDLGSLAFISIHFPRPTLALRVLARSAKYFSKALLDISSYLNPHSHKIQITGK
jgi:hypothetical protein